MDAASAHLMIGPGAELHSVLDRARQLLRDNYRIYHATLQVEPDSHERCDDVAW